MLHTQGIFRGEKLAAGKTEPQPEITLLRFEEKCIYGANVTQTGGNNACANAPSSTY